MKLKDSASASKVNFQEFIKNLSASEQANIRINNKQQKEKQRDADKLRKKHIKTEAELEPSQNDKQNAFTASKQSTSNIAWLLLALSWISFIIYLSFK